MDIPEFFSFNKIPRLNRDIQVSEKIDGSNAQILITEDGRLYAGSRKRWITPEKDNFGFAAWCKENEEELLKLGPGRHYGEWWGQGIQRNYGLKEKRFSLFNVKKWGSKLDRPACCDVVPLLYEGAFSTRAIDYVLLMLMRYGSHAAPGFFYPEGVVVYHLAANQLFKITLEGDDKPKGVER
jgi:hypothetical protein